MDAAEEVRSLCRALATALDANKGVRTDPDERLLDAEALAAKCLFHASSCLTLADGTRILDEPNVLDIASLNVLVRAAIESSLVFHYLIVSPRDGAEAELRHLSWVLADLLERQAFPASLPESQNTQLEERKQIEAFSARLRANAEFQKLTDKQQRRVLEDSHWSPGWAQVARGAGLSDLHATLVHRYLCSYAHSGSLSVLQFRQAKTREDRECFRSTALQLVAIAVATMTTAYCTAFPRAAAALLREPGVQAVVDRWVHVSREA